MKPVAMVAGSLVALTAFTAGALVGVGQEAGSDLAAPLSASQPALSADQYQGVCAVVTPPAPDPCDAISGTLRYGFFGALVNSAYHPKWSQQNPGEVSRLAGIMATPRCSQAPTGLAPVMRTFYGAALEAVVQSIGCARHPEPITMPAPNPPLNPNRADKTPPSAPGPITATP